MGDADTFLAEQLARTARSGLRGGRHPADAAPPARLRPQLLLHLDLHGRSSALARGAASLNDWADQAPVARRSAGLRPADRDRARVGPAPAGIGDAGRRGSYIYSGRARGGNRRADRGAGIWRRRGGGRRRRGRRSFGRLRSPARPGRKARRDNAGCGNGHARARFLGR